MRRMRRAARFAAPLLLFGCVVTLQVVNGAYDNEFGGHSDEAAHYITGLMVRDYFLSPPWQNPVRYAERYYVHYPKVAIGHWPPLFYVVQACWTIPFGPSRTSVLLLMAVLTTSLAWTLGRVIAGGLGPRYGLAMALTLVGLPLTQRLTGMLMAEIPVALLTFWSALAWGRYMDRGRWGDATTFGVLAAAAILTKGNGICLALVPPLAVLLARRPDLLARGWTYWPAAVVAVLCGPWYAITLSMPGVASGIAVDHGSYAQYVVGSAVFYGFGIVNFIGIAVSALAAVGFLTRVALELSGERVGGVVASLTALILASLIVQCVVPVSNEPRFLMPIVAPVLALAAEGLDWISGRVRDRGLGPHLSRVLLALAFALIAWEMIWPTGYRCRGYRAVARDLLAEPSLGNSVLLVSADDPGEGMFIAEVAGAERRPGRVVLRASKVLAQSRWNLTGYTPIFRTAEEVMGYLERVPVEAVVVDTTIAPETARLRQQPELLQALASHADRWRMLGAYTLIRGRTVAPGAIKVYRLVGGRPRGNGPVRIDMGEVLNRTLELQP
ncbi:MAG TPA: glycosyltransferase family 39 protein [Isosphaeraceae bacterium]